MVEEEKLDTEGKPIKKRSHTFMMILAILCFIVLIGLRINPSRHVFGINEDPYIAQIQLNISNLWSKVSGPVMYVWDHFLKNTWGGALSSATDSLEKGEMPSFPQFSQPDFSNLAPQGPMPANP